MRNIQLSMQYQGNHYAENAMTIAIDILKKEYGVSKINLGHRKVNIAAARLYEKLGFVIVGEDEQDYFRTKVL